MKLDSLHFAGIVAAAKSLTMKSIILPLALIGITSSALFSAAGEEAKTAPFTMTTDTPSDVKAAPEDAIKTASGLASKVLKKGTGTTKPDAADTVTVHYSGWTTDGKLFDSSVKRGQPTSLPLANVIKGWTEGMQLVGEGGMIELEVPFDLAYGERGRPGIPPKSTLHFIVELLEVK